jgi:uncharacterized membrane protein (DUF106 family)
MTLLDSILPGIEVWQEITLITFFLSVTLFIVNKKLVNQNRLEEIKATVKAHQNKMKEAKKNKDEDAVKQLESEQKQVMSLTSEMMKMSMKPLMYTTIPFLGLFWFLGQTYSGEGIVIIVPVLGSLDWIGWYILSAIFFGMISEGIYQKYRKSKKKAQEVKV